MKMQMSETFSPLEQLKTEKRPYHPQPRIPNQTRKQYPVPKAKEVEFRLEKSTKRDKEKELWKLKDFLPQHIDRIPILVLDRAGGDYIGHDPLPIESSPSKSRA